MARVILFLFFLVLVFLMGCQHCHTEVAVSYTHQDCSVTYAMRSR